MYHKIWFLTLCLAAFTLLNTYAEDNAGVQDIYKVYQQKHKTTKTLYPKSSKVIQTPKAQERITTQDTIQETHQSISKEKTLPVTKESSAVRPKEATQNTKVNTADTPKTSQKLKTKKENVITIQMPAIQHPSQPISQKEILKILSTVKVIKSQAAQEIMNSIKVIQAIKPLEQSQLPKVPSSPSINIAKAKAVGEIAKSVAFVESAKAVAKANIAQSVANVQLAQMKQLDKEPSTKEVIQAKKKSALQVTQAVTTTEIAKAKSAAKIAKIVADVEVAKTKKTLEEKLFQ